MSCSAYLDWEISGLTDAALWGGASSICSKQHVTFLDRSDFYFINNLSIAVKAFTGCTLTSLSIDEILLSRYVNRSTNFESFLLKVEMAISCLKYMYSFFIYAQKRPISLATISRLCSWDSAWAAIFTRNARSSLLSASVIVSAETKFWKIF